MNTMKLFDLHCDTPLELYHGNKRLCDNDLHISLKKADCFDKYVQCAAVWCDSKKSDAQCFEAFKAVFKYFSSEASELLITSKEELQNSKKYAFILTVEDSRLVDSSPERIDFLYSCGVRVLTLLWGGTSSVGAAWNAEGGLTPLGKDILERCFDTGIIPDISHANDEVSSFALNRAEKKGLPIIATHSNSRTVYPHMRNLTDENAKGIANAGGIVGISLYPPHLKGEKAEISDIISHIDHYLNILGADSVCLGCDFDGIGSTPEGIADISHLPRLYEALSKKCTSSIAENVFYNNAYKFFIKNLP